MRTFPRLRSTLAASMLLGLLAAAPAQAEESTPTTDAQQNPATTSFDAAVDVTAIDLVNAERAANGLPALVEHLQLTRIAREHSKTMAASSDQGGNCGDGATLRHRAPLSSGITANWRVLRENVGCGPDKDADRLHRAFMQSAGHRDNILADDITSIGIGSWIDADGALWVTHLFMRGGNLPQLDVVTEGLLAAADHLATGQDFEGVVLSRSDVFADSLGGAALAGDALPILFTDAPGGDETNPVLRPAVRAAIDALTGGDGIVYVLGGSKAISPAVAAELATAGYDVRRLAGTDRISTGVAIANEVIARNGAPSHILIASAFSWPDAVTGSVAAARAGVPVLLTHPGTLTEVAANFLAAHQGAERIVLGGSAAVSDAVTAQVGASRVQGPGRIETSLAIAQGLFGEATSETMLINAYAPTSWATSLAWAGRSVREATPQLLVAPNGRQPEPVESYMASRSGTNY